MLHALIMAGGGGTRFWPRSRTARPKQFLRFSGDRTLLQATYDRIAAQVPAERVWVITGADYVAEARQQLPELQREQIVGEPVGRDTAACISLGAALIAQTDPGAAMIVMPADHLIEPEREFHRAVHAAAQVIEEYPESLLTFGIPPTFPATGYGYILRGRFLGERQRVPVYQVEAFAEKPDFDTAERFVASGDYFWNSGIFVWRAATILGELRRLQPQLYSAIERIIEAWPTPNREAILCQEYQPLTKISIDYAVMQEAGKSGKVLVLRAPYQWDDVGSWLALERRHPQDADGNTVQGEHLGINTQQCVIVSDPGHLIATIGVKNLLIIQDGNATLIADRCHEGQVKAIVEQLKSLHKWQYL